MNGARRCSNRATLMELTSHESQAIPEVGASGIGSSAPDVQPTVGR